MKKKIELNYNELKASYESEHFQFETTNDLQLEHEMLAQKEAVDMFLFGLQMKSDGYNIYISGSDENTIYDYVTRKVKDVALNEDTPDDLCYIYDFDNPSTPKYLFVKSGQGKAFKDDMQELKHFLKEELNDKLESYGAEKERQLLIDELDKKKELILKKLKVSAKELGFDTKVTKDGIGFIPLDENGEVIAAEDYEELDEEIREEIKSNIDTLYDLSSHVINDTKALEKEYATSMKEIDEKIILHEVGYYINYMQKRFKESKAICTYLDGILNDILENIDLFTSEASDEVESLTQMIPWVTIKSAQDIIERYDVNVLVSRKKNTGAPVVTDTSVSYSKLYGKIKIDTELSSVKADFTSILSGLLHEANGGYLLLKMSDVIDAPGTWEGIKQALKSKKVIMENLGSNTITTTIGLRPEPVPLNVKVILIGNYEIYNVLTQYDTQFKNLFKVNVDFEDTIESTVDNTLKFAKLIKAYCIEKQLPPVTKEGIRCLLEYSHRKADSKEKLSAHMGCVYDLVQEASVFADEAITEENIKTIRKIKGFFKENIERKMQEQYVKNMLLIDTTGKKIGQINGLAVYQIENYTFGRPTRITATTFRGKTGVVDIETAVGLSGSIHSKGVQIITGFLGHYFAKDYPLSLSCRICFEQNYGGIDGDSASSAELYTILSSLADVPIRQGIAVTGSINQYGEIQPVGGVNDKIEGFYQVCKQKGLTGNQGVIIPYQNKEDLMLNDEVIEAVEQGKFHIYAISSYKQGIQLLSGMPYTEIEKKIQNKFRSYQGEKSRRLF